MKAWAGWLGVSCVLSGCATMIHGPFEDVRIVSTPAGATASISPMLSQRGPSFLDSNREYTVTTPGTVRLRRDNTYRIEVAKPGYRIASTKVLSSYDWLWAPVVCGPCEAVGDLPSFDMKGRALPLRFLEAGLYSYPKGFIGAWGRGLRLFSPEALLGTSYKLRSADAGFVGNWHAVGVPEVSVVLERLD
jgi:hypothetical protein